MTLSKENYNRAINNCRGPVAILVLLLAGLVLQAIVITLLGQPLICTCGTVRLWYDNPAGAETSQQVADWYSLTHIEHGILFYALSWLAFPQASRLRRLALVLGTEIGWEILENVPLMIERYRLQALARGYRGDSVINSLFDTMATMLGYAIARLLPPRYSAVIFLSLELGLAYAIRDNLVLNIVQLLHPSGFLSSWQSSR